MRKVMEMRSYNAIDNLLLQI